MKKHLLGLAAVSTMLTPIAASAATEVQFWHAFTGRLGELVALLCRNTLKLCENFTQDGWIFQKIIADDLTDFLFLAF